MTEEETNDRDTEVLKTIYILFGGVMLLACLVGVVGLKLLVAAGWVG